MKKVELIRINLELVQNKIHLAAKNSGRDPGDVKVVVVTKSQTKETVHDALLAGVKILGENYAEEGIRKKIDLEFDDQVEWHMIGHIQSRKARLVALHFDLVHSLDSYKLAQKLDHESNLIGKRLPVLLEFNVGGENNKFGWVAKNEADWPSLVEEIKPITSLMYLKICGLMTMPPLVEKEEDSRPYFQKLKKLQFFFKNEIPEIEWKELSMGTSLDYKIAVEEGATYVRVGQAILGPRI